MSERVWIGLGSNQDGPEAQLRAALPRLDALPQTRLTAVSGLYASPPLRGPGVPDQPDYRNAVAELETALLPATLLGHLHEIEAVQQRRRTVVWGPRTLDLDLLLCERSVCDDDTVRVPHPELHRRAFVLYPLAELAPDFTVPGIGRVEDLRAALTDPPIERLADAGEWPFAR